MKLRFPPAIFSAAKPGLVDGTRKVPHDLAMKGGKQSRETMAVIA